MAKSFRYCGMRVPTTATSSTGQPCNCPGHSSEQKRVVCSSVSLHYFSEWSSFSFSGEFQSCRFLALRRIHDICVYAYIYIHIHMCGTYVLLSPIYTWVVCHKMGWFICSPKVSASRVFRSHVFALLYRILICWFAAEWSATVICLGVWNLPNIVRLCFALPMLLQFCWENTVAIGAKPKGICWRRVVASEREMLWQGKLQFRGKQSTQYEMDWPAERADHEAHPMLCSQVHSSKPG